MFSGSKLYEVTRSEWVADLSAQVALERHTGKLCVRGDGNSVTCGYLSYSHR